MRRGAEIGSLRRLVAGFDSRRLRLDPGRGAVKAMGVVALLAAVAAGGWVLSARPTRLSAAPAVQATQASLAPGGSLASPLPTPSAAGSGTPLVVDVVGKVRRPGVYRLPGGSRVTDAVTAAGGPLAGVDLTSVNLARKLADGEQIAIGVAAAAPAAGDSGPGAGVAGSLLDLNSATEAQLDALPGVGPVLAQHIVEWRTAHGRFTSVDELNSVSGIGDAKFADLKPLVTAS